MKKNWSGKLDSVNTGSLKTPYSSDESRMRQFITGFADAEGCFYVRVSKKAKMKVGWAVELVFSIRLHIKDLALLEAIAKFFGVGKVYTHEKTQEASYVVNTVKELGVIIEHFLKYPLRTQKWSDFMLFKQVWELFASKKHLTKEGLEQIVNIKAAMNTGTYLEAFPNTAAVVRPTAPKDLAETPIDPSWMAGFVSGDGCFSVHLKDSPLSTLGERVWLRLIVTQHSRDKELLDNFVDFFGCGIVGKDSRVGKEASYFVVQKFCDIIEKIIPFFDEYPVLGVKSKDYEDFKRCVNYIELKTHLTLDGLNAIRELAQNMNRSRKV